VAYGPQKLTDADPWSAWITDEEVKTAEVVLELGKEQTFNLIRLREDIRLGQRVDEVAVDVWTLGAWKEVAKAQSIGAMRLWKVEETKTYKVRLRVTQTAACPAISDFGLYYEPAAPLFWGLKQNTPPPPDRPVGGTVGYFLRSGEHDVTAADWANYVAFSRRQLAMIP
jgi:hypothetical protein